MGRKRWAKVCRRCDRLLIQRTVDPKAFAKQNNGEVQRKAALLERVAKGRPLLELRDTLPDKAPPRRKRKDGSREAKQLTRGALDARMRDLLTTKIWDAFGGARRQDGGA